jgi:putative oxidoreductase
MQESSPSAFSACDRIAANSSSVLLLVGRILLGWLFFYSGYLKLTGMAGTIAYFTNLKMPMPEVFAWVAGLFELIVGAALILGIATRYASLAVFVFVLIATLLAHRYWEFEGAAMGGQRTNFLKNLAIMGCSLALFVTGGGGMSVDAKMKK